MVTNLSAFPSSLTCIPMPDGEPKKHREDFFVNENLKRLGCSGRMGISIQKPSTATQNKFYQLYRASDKVDLYKAVIELVKLCQIALTLFDMLGPEYADGLLCDVTEKALNDWWVEIGNDLYNVEPQDGILGPTTVAALLGTLIGARNRLSAYGAQTSKDVFDIEVTKRAIAYFQKSQRLPKTRRLDRTTLNKLHSATAKAATSEGWNVARAVKSTVAEVGGKGGEMVLETLGAKDKAGIADVETADIEQFVQLVRGERAKWLWYGKARKGTTGDMFNRLNETEGMVFKPDEHGGYTWQGSRKNSMVPQTPATPGGFRASMENGHDRDAIAEEDHAHMPKLTKRNTRGEHDGKIGGKIRNAVGLRSHRYNKHSKDDLDEGSPTRTAPYNVGMAAAIHPERAGKAIKAEGSFRETTKNNLTRTDTSQTEVDKEALPMITQTITETPLEEEDLSLFTNKQQEAANKPRKPPPMTLDAPFAYQQEVSPARTPTVGSSIGGSTYRGVDLDELFPNYDVNLNVGKLLRRRNSAMTFDERFITKPNPEKLPKRLSFSVAEQSVLTWDTSSWEIDPASLEPKEGSATNPRILLAKQTLVAEDSMRTRAKLAFMDSIVGRWVDDAIVGLKALEDLAEQDLQELDSLYYPRLEVYQGLKLESQEALAGEKARLTEILKDVEVLGAKLEYEINALRSRVEDVEEGVEEYEKQVGAVEGLVAELEERYVRHCDRSWMDWLCHNFGWLGKLRIPATSLNTPRPPQQSITPG